MEKKIGQRWLWKSTDNHFIVEITGFNGCNHYNVNVVQYYFGDYQLHSRHSFPILDKAWSLLEGQDKSIEI
jgi:hypothetical protein